jgi:hypothetical protein
VPIDVGTVGDAFPDDVFLAAAGSVTQLLVLCRLRGRTMAATKNNRRNSKENASAQKEKKNKDTLSRG